ncbi:hypothetical protein TSUD_394510 [Trifolium subterraneum]|uniref:Uncharacterized protein n=1 Tax=Trifolium subterraneum TaxID=3900 RepID=A0A2Z6MQF8_TRISU|nr:hypothetical protein TSUD_394510 [Trifolium subterraneum]
MKKEEEAVKPSVHRFLAVLAGFHRFDCLSVQQSDQTDTPSDMIYIWEEPVESWGICAYEADKSLKRVPSAHLRYYFMVYYFAGIAVCDSAVVYYASRPDGGARRFVVPFSLNIPGGRLCTCRHSDAQVNRGGGRRTLTNGQVDLGLCFGLCSTAQERISSTRWAFRPSPEQEPPKSSCSSTRMMTLVGRRSDASVGDLRIYREVEGFFQIPFIFSTSPTSQLLFSQEFLSSLTVSSDFDSSSSFALPIRLFVNRLSSIHRMLSDIHALESSDIRVFLEFPVMVDNQIQRKIPVGDNMDWVADDLRTTPARFELGEHYPKDLFTEIEELDPPNWEIMIPGARQRICTAFRNGGIPMYQIVFEHMGLRLPFSDLEVAIFNHWEHRKLLDIFEESLRNFKDEYFVVRPMVVEGWKAILVRGPMVDDDGNVVFGDDVEPIEVDCERFPFCWSTKHYSREAKSFTFKTGALSKEERADLKVLEDFVDSFPPNLWEDKEGNPICDEEGRRLSSKKFINTKALLKCATKTEAKDLLREMKNTQLTLCKLQAEKKKRQLGASSSTPNASGQSSPSSSIEVTGVRGVAEEVTGAQRPPKHARVEGGGSMVSGPHRLIPGKAAAKFILPPAKRHDCLLHGKTEVKISDADQTILASMGPESLRNVVAESSVAVFKLLEVATFLNGRECKYLRERDEARAHAKDFGERLSAVEKDLSSETKALKESQAKVRLEKDLQDAKEEEERLKGKVIELEEQVSRLSLGPAVEEEEKKLEPEGTCAKSSRADLIAKIYQISDLQLDVASSIFKNALAQLQVVNPDVQLVTEGMDEMKEVRDGQIATPPLEEED